MQSGLAPETAVLVAAAGAAAPASGPAPATYTYFPARKAYKDTPAVQINKSSGVFINSELLKKLPLTPGQCIQLKYEVDGVEQHNGCFFKTLSKHNDWRGLNILVPKDMLEVVKGMYHSGWQMCDDGAIVLILSKTDSRRMTLEECLVSCLSG